MGTLCGIRRTRKQERKMANPPTIGPPIVLTDEPA
jgi:hypothetical protein